MKEVPLTEIDAPTGHPVNHFWSIAWKLRHLTCAYVWNSTLTLWLLPFPLFPSDRVFTCLLLLTFHASMSIKDVSFDMSTWNLLFNVLRDSEGLNVHVHVDYLFVILHGSLRILLAVVMLQALTAATSLLRLSLLFVPIKFYGSSVQTYFKRGTLTSTGQHVHSRQQQQQQQRMETLCKPLLLQSQLPAYIAALSYGALVAMCWDR